MQKESLPAPENYFKKVDILQLTVKQIEKDFGLEKGSLKVPEQPEEAYKLLLDRISEIVGHLVQRNQQKLMNSLYRIDVSQDRMKLILESQTKEPANELIAKEIVYREIQKVITRLYFSSKKRDRDLLKLRDTQNPKPD